MDALIKQRGVVKAKVTRAATFLQQATASAQAINIQEVITRLELLEKTWTEYNEINEKIVMEASTDEIPAHIRDEEEVESRYVTIKSGLKTLMIDSAQSTNSTSSQLSQIAPRAKTEVKLPRMDLPTFNGDYLQWTMFKDLFTSIIHNNTSISNSQKLHYLKNALQGEASSLIASFDTTDVNYNEAWNVLVERYENERQIITCHMKGLFNQRSVTAETPSELRKLLDTTTKHVRALKVLKVPVENWDHVLVYLVSERMDAESHKQWELSIKGKQFPKFEELRLFLDQRCRALENSQPATSLKSTGRYSSNNKGSAAPVKVHNTSVVGMCPICQAPHPIYRCEQFLQMEPRARAAAIKDLSICFNCFKAHHSARDCNSKSTCRECKKRHNTLLHFNRPSQDRNTPQDETTTDNSPAVRTHTVSHMQHQVLLATAVVNVKNSSGQLQKCRVLLDNASEATFITETCAQRLGISRRAGNLPVSGVGDSAAGNTRGVVQLEVFSCVSKFQLTMTAFVLRKLTSIIPRQQVDISNWRFPPHIQLADKNFDKPSGIDILIGADYYYDIETSEVVAKCETGARMKSTQFGWVITGPISDSIALNPINIHLTSIDLSSELRRFWELEEIPTKQYLTIAEQQCETHFLKTHTRDTSGHYVVAFPFNSVNKELGDSFQMASRRFLSTERRLLASDKCYQQYKEFMREYEELGHMEEVPSADTSQYNYLPHHHVMREDSTTTKLRVVFDASAKTSSGCSLNDKLLTGAKIQDDIFDILLRFRSHRIAVTADIAKMFRQVKMKPEERNLQCVLWRASADDPIKTYKLNTVTYGTASGPFLATRSLYQLSIDESETNSITRAIQQDFYVDDLMTGENSIPCAQRLCKHLFDTLSRGGFELRKWASNEPRALDMLPEEFCEPLATLPIETDSTIKTLGLQWNTRKDNFTFHVNLSTVRQASKRTILSNVARLFDPLGWIAPVVVKAKILLQGLWLSGLDWDDPAPPNIQREWAELQGDFHTLQELAIPRFILDKTASVQIHGFCDASQLAYGAAVYIRCEHRDMKVTVNLLCAKTKVAPIKQVSLPRLELCAAVLLARLVSRVSQCFNLQTTEIVAWSDSTITLAWIKNHPSKWKTFVANRVAEIQDLISPNCWFHVPTQLNPADVASRGTLPTSLRTHDLWWTGPPFLQSDRSEWPQKNTTEVTKLEEKKQERMCNTLQTDKHELLDKYSSLQKLLRVTAYCQRFVNNLKKRKNERTGGSLTTTEINNAMFFWVKTVQGVHFAVLVKALQEKKLHSYMQLAPFIDDLGIVRVGGRIQRATVSYDQRHPMLIPKTSKLTELIINDYHHKLLHPGTQLLLATVRQRFWIVNGRSVVRQNTHKCVTCTRDKAKVMEQQMGELPATRVNAVRPFLKTGVDFGGPYRVKNNKGRGGKITKVYIALFVCFATKAVHLELVSELSSEAFIATLKRFISRRGRCSDIYSDNGTNFVGANNELKELLQLFNRDRHQTIVSNYTTEQGINWHFMPPSAPHFGGLWEAGIKSTKQHLRRVIGETTLTFEEFVTVLTQVEACLNSRPLCPLSNDPNDLQALTPGHFLIGAPLTSIPEPDLTELRLNHLSRWQLLQQLSQHFWKRWHTEYLTQLQQRSKWADDKNQIQLGNLVLIKEDNLPPLKWMMGRVVAMHPGADNFTRVVTLRTKNGLFKRPVVKLCKLPVECC